MDKLARLSSRAEIQDVMFRYARGVDRLDLVAVRACFHEDATDHHGDFKGKIGDFIPWVSAMHASVPFSAHFLGNCLIEFVDDITAVVESYFMTMLQQAEKHKAIFLRGAGASGDIEMDVIGRYVDRFESRDGSWRIAKRAVVFDAIRTRASNKAALKDSWALGKRSCADPVYEAREKAGLGAT